MTARVRGGWWLGVLVGLVFGSAADAAHPRLMGYLAQLEARAEGAPGLALGPTTRSQRQLYSDFVTHADGRVLVYIRNEGGATEAAFARVGGVAMGTAGRYTFGRVDPTQLSELAAQPGVGFVQPQLKPLPLDVQTGEGVAFTNATAFHGLGLDGAGSTVFVFDVGFGGAGALFGTELPADTERMYFGEPINTVEGGGANVHGTAVAEICHEMAPAAKIVLVYANAPVTFDDFADAIISHPASHKVLNASVGYFAEPFDGLDGPLADMVNRLINAGVLFVASSGNHALLHYYGRFTDADADGLHEFSPGDEQMNFEGLGLVQAVLQWDNYPAGRLDPATDVDLAFEVVDSAGTVLYTQDDPQTGSQRPQELLGAIISGATGTCGLRVRMVSAGANNVTPNINIFNLYTNTVDPADIVRRTSCLTPSVVPGVVSVGAVDVTNGTLESFSSRGPTADGRQCPIMSGPDNVTSVAYAGRWNGTSAASPHVAGAAALLRGAVPMFDVTQTVALLRQNVVDAGPSGPDNQYGDGILLLNPATVPGGVDVNLAVVTTNFPAAQADGARAMDATQPATVQFTWLGAARTTTVADGAVRAVRVDPNTTVTFPATVASTLRGQRWAAATGQLDLPVGSTPTDLSVNYVHQLQKSFRADVVTGSEIDPSYKVNVSVQDGPQTVTTALLSSGSPAEVQALVWANTGSTATFDTTAQPLDNTVTAFTDQRWWARDTDSDGVPNPPSGRVSRTISEVVGEYYHQVRPKVTLNGTNSGSTVSTIKRRFLGVDRQTLGLFGSFHDWCDNGTQLEFSKQSTGSPILAVEGVAEFAVTPTLDGVVNYIIQPQTATTGLALSRTTAPANGRTPIEVLVTVRDSANQPVAGISADRVDIFVEPTEGVHITNAAGATDSTGQLRFQVTRDVPGVVTVRGTLDGETLRSNQAGALGTELTVQGEFLQVMTVALPLPGVYLVSFPITPADSRQTFTDFNLDPSPPQVARLVTGTTRYEFFRPDAANAAFDIRPGTGFFVRTNAPGAAELTGTRSDNAGPFNFALAPAGFHQLGNPRESRAMQWRMADFEVFLEGVSQGTLAQPANWALVDPFAWVYNGQEYEQVVDPILPGTDGLRTQIGVFEGFFWRSRRDGVGVVYRPDVALSRGAEPVSANHFGLGLTATQGDAAATVVVGCQATALRSGSAPPPPAGEAGVTAELVTADGGRAVADWAAGPLTRSRTWTLVVTGRAAGEDVVLTWPYLSRQLPAGYRARLTDPTTGRSVVLNSTASYRYQGTGERQFQVTVEPRGSDRLAVLSFEASGGRGRSVSFRVQVSDEAELVVRVSSLGGRVVAETRPQVSSGWASVVWDGLDSAGRPVPRGTYQVTLVARSAEGETVRATRTVTLR